MNLWQNYKKVLFNTFNLEPDVNSYMMWEGKRNTSLKATEYRHKYFLNTPILVITYSVKTVQKIISSAWLVIMFFPLVC